MRETVSPFPSYKIAYIGIAFLSEELNFNPFYLLP